MTKHNGHSARRCATCEPAEEAHLPGHQSVPAPTNSQYFFPPEPPGEAPARVCFFNDAAPETQRRRVAVLPHYCANERRRAETQAAAIRQFMNFAATL